MIQMIKQKTDELYMYILIYHVRLYMYISFYVNYAVYTDVIM